MVEIDETELERRVRSLMFRHGARRSRPKAVAIQVILGRDAAREARRRRKRGQSLRKIASELSESTGITVSHETVRRWTQS